MGVSEKKNDTRNEFPDLFWFAFPFYDVIKRTNKFKVLASATCPCNLKTAHKDEVPGLPAPGGSAHRSECTQTTLSPKLSRL